MISLNMGGANTKSFCAGVIAGGSHSYRENFASKPNEYLETCTILFPSHNKGSIFFREVVWFACQIQRCYEVGLQIESPDCPISEILFFRSVRSFSTQKGWLKLHSKPHSGCHIFFARASGGTRKSLGKKDVIFDPSIFVAVHFFNAKNRGFDLHHLVAKMVVTSVFDRKLRVITNSPLFRGLIFNQLLGLLVFIL